MEIRTIVRRFRAAPALVFLALAACGGGEAPAGGGSGGVGTGPIAGFGSVIVNGVRFDDAGIPADRVLDDSGRVKAGLRAGMMVAVTGAIVGPDGRADDIEILRHADGPMDDNAVDLAAGRLKVMGQDVRVDAATVFDNGATSLAFLKALQGADEFHPEIEVHGVSDNNGVIRATYLNKRADDNVAGREVQLRGTVAAPPLGSTFRIGRQTVGFGGVPGGLPAGVAAGSFVEVKGVLGALDNILAAVSVRLEDATGGQPSGDRAEIEGFIVTPIVSSGTGGSFRLRGPAGFQVVTWTAASTVFEGGLQAGIRSGAKAEVEGVRMPDRSLAAARVTFRRASDIRLEGVATSLTPDNLTVFGKPVKVDGLTRYEDGRDLLRTFGQGNIAVNDALRISAYLDNSTFPASIVAVRVERTSALPPNGNILQGAVDSFLPLPDGSSLVILGDLAVVTADASTVFRDAEGTPISQAAFLQILQDVQAAGRVSVVKARGTAPTPIVNMQAAEVGFEPAGED